MLNAPTLEQLQALKLATMATAWTEQQQQAEMTPSRLTNASRSSSTPSGARGRISA